MAIKIRSILKSFFTTGSTPTAAQFASLIDSFFHLGEDTLTISQINHLADALANKVTAAEAQILIDKAVTNQLTDTQYERIMSLIYIAATATLEVLPTTFEKGLPTNLTFTWDIEANDDTIDSALLSDTDISNNLSSAQIIEAAVATTSKQLVVNCADDNNNISITKKATAITPQWRGYTAATLDNTYTVANTNLTKFVSSSVAATVTVDELVDDAKVVFLTIDSDATINDANNFDITSAFTKSTITQELADGTTVTLYKYETTDVATLGTYKLK